MRKLRFRLVNKLAPLSLAKEVKLSVSKEILEFKPFPLRYTVSPYELIQRWSPTAREDPRGRQLGGPKVSC